MNCRYARKEIVDALACGGSGFHAELDQHLGACASCRAFSASQTSLFTDVDSHLRLVVNEHIPPSLMAGVIARLPKEDSPRLQWFSARRIAGVAVLAVLVAAVDIQLRRSNPADRVSERAAESVASAANTDHERPVKGRVQVSNPKTSQAQGVRKASIPAPASAPAVLVSREEQEAFAHFVNEISNDRDSAIALASAAPENGDAPLEIALLKIESVEVRPLERSDRE